MARRLTSFGLLLGLALSFASGALAQDEDNPYGTDSADSKKPAKADKKGKADKDKADAAKPEQEPTPPPAEGSGVSEPPKAASAAKAPRAKPDRGEGPKADTRSAEMRAYQAAMKDRRLAATAPITRQRLKDELVGIEEKLDAGRRDEAVAQLVYIVEAERFDAFKETDEGRACIFWLGDSLGRAGAHGPARGYLERLLTGKVDVWFRRAIRSLVDFGLESDHPEVFLKAMEPISSKAPEEQQGDIAYLDGRAKERQKRPVAALRALAKVTPRSRFWAQATYLAGLIEVERGQLKKGENLFCKVADPKATPKQALLFGGSDFFRVRDLARLALGRVAHEQYRFDDSRYYYYLVPADSDALPEALYESATGRYEAKDYEGARELLDELRKTGVDHPYEDEAWILDAYVDLAACKFPQADKKLSQFLKRYEPVRDTARALSKDKLAVRKLVEAIESGSDPAAAGVTGDARRIRAVAALLRLDPAYGRSSRRLAQLEHQQSGLRGALGELDDTREVLAKPGELKAQAEGPIGDSPDAKLARIDQQLEEVRRLVREAKETSKGKTSAELKALEKSLEELEKRAKDAHAATQEAAPKGEKAAKDLPGLVVSERERATALYNEAQKLRQVLLEQQERLAQDALIRLDKRLSRLLRRARLGRIETVLGRKRALELEVEALSQGLLPQQALDSLDAARFLGDDEEYWPFDGEDWADEYVGGEGLR
ncbi:MAG: hypothetical protein AB7K71_22490 [Polyangiaceae bacterium]